MKKIKFIKSRFDAQWSYELPDGRFIEILSLDGEFSLRYDAQFSLETGEIAEKENSTTLNELKAQGIGRTVYCYDEYDVNLGSNARLTRTKVDKIIKEFKAHGFNVTVDALRHNYNAWRCGMKSGYRDEKNGYHLFSPCGCNPLSFRATTLNKHCKDWQETYSC